MVDHAIRIQQSIGGNQRRRGWQIYWMAGKPLVCEIMGDLFSGYIL